MRLLAVSASLLLACTPEPAATMSEAMSSSTGPEAPGATTTSGATSGATGDPTVAPTATGDPASTGSTTGAPAGPCGQPPPFTGVMPQTIEAAGQQRDYDLAIPADYDPDTAYPLVFAWHGRGGNGQLARLYFKVEESSQGQAIFVYPDGLPLPDMNNQTGWDLTPNGADIALFDAILADVRARLCVDDARIFSTGHSFGGYMSNAVGCARGDVVRAIAPVAGGGPFFPCAGPVAAWIAHGMSDSTVPFSQGEGSRDHWAGADGCDMAEGPVEPAPCVAYTGCDDGLPVHWCAHDEPTLGGHGWPDWAGPAIWSFFAAL